jgi:hypothetical protein
MTDAQAKRKLIEAIKRLFEAAITRDHRRDGLIFRKMIATAALSFGSLAVVFVPAQARGGFGVGFHARLGGFDGRNVHAGISGFRRGHARVGRFDDGFGHEFPKSSLPGRWRIGRRHGLSVIDLGWALAPFIQAKIASYFDSYLAAYSSAVEGGTPMAPCDAQCISARYLRVTVKAPAIRVARAADIPIYDVNRNCAALQGAPSRNYCLKEEQENYDIIKSLWADIPDKVKGQTLARMGDIMRGNRTATHAYTTMKGHLIAYLRAEELRRPAEPFHE